MGVLSEGRSEKPRTCGEGRMKKEVRLLPMLLNGVKKEGRILVGGRGKVGAGKMGAGVHVAYRFL